MDKESTGTQILLVPTKVLLLIAAVVWFLAGTSVATVGLKASKGVWTLGMVGVSLGVFGFFLMLFLRLSRRNAERITGHPNRLSFVLGFFDANSYMVIAVMVFLSAAIRVSTLVPESIIAAFYCGLGAALVLAGSYPLITFIQTWESPGFK